MKAEILPRFTVQQAEFIRLMQSKDQHFIIVGGRGHGKTLVHQLAMAEDAEAEIIEQKKIENELPDAGC